MDMYLILKNTLHFNTTFHLLRIHDRNNVVTIWLTVKYSKDQLGFNKAWGSFIDELLIGRRTRFPSWGYPTQAWLIAVRHLI